MDNTIERLLSEEIEKTLSTIKTLDATSDKAKAELMKLTRLQELRTKELDAILKEQQRADAVQSKVDDIEFKNVEAERRQKQFERELEVKRTEISERLAQEIMLRRLEADQRKQQLEKEISMKEKELDQKTEELKEAKRTRRWKTVVDVIAIGAPLGFSLYGMFKGFEFEQEGKIYSSRTPQFLSGITRLFGKK